MFSLPPSLNIKDISHQTSQQFKVHDVLPPSLFEHQRHSRMKHHSNSKALVFSLPPSLNIKDIHAWNITVIQSPWCSPSLPLWTSKTFTNETSQQFKVYDVLPPSLFEHQGHFASNITVIQSPWCSPSLPPSLNIKDIHAWNITAIQSPWCSPSLLLWKSKYFNSCRTYVVSHLLKTLFTCANSGLPSA